MELLDAKVSAHCNRVAVEDGHTECVSIKLRSKATREQIVAAWAEFAPLAGQRLPSAPEQPVEYDASSRPAAAAVGQDAREWHGRHRGTAARVQPAGLEVRADVSHNTIRGAAGAAVLNAEVLARLGKLDWKKQGAARPDAVPA